VLLLSSHPTTSARAAYPAGLPSRVRFLVGGGLFIGALLEAAQPGGAEKEGGGTFAAGANNFSDEAASVVDDETARVLLADVAGMPAPKLEEELRHLRRLAQANVGSAETKVEAPQEDSNRAVPTPAAGALHVGPEHPDILSSVDPALANLLLADVGEAGPHQLRHEVRLLREMLAAERSKLRQMVRGMSLGRGTSPWQGQELTGDSAPPVEVGGQAQMEAA
jgi:hypothetical protein